jgi:hypothetical protein
MLDVIMLNVVSPIALRPTLFRPSPHLVKMPEALDEVVGRVRDFLRRHRLKQARLFLSMNKLAR